MKFDWKISSVQFLNFSEIVLWKYVHFFFKKFIRNFTVTELFKMPFIPQRICKFYKKRQSTNFGRWRNIQNKIKIPSRNGPLNFNPISIYFPCMTMTCPYLMIDVKTLELCLYKNETFLNFKQYRKRVAKKTLCEKQTFTWINCDKQNDISSKVKNTNTSEWGQK